MKGKKAPQQVNIRLKTARTSLGFSIEEVAKLLKVDVRTYQRWENEHQRPSLRLQRVLCKLLDATPDQLDF